jgi:hypothetical protein
VTQAAITISIASKTFTQTINNPGLAYTYDFTWNGMDASGNTLSDGATAQVLVRFTIQDGAVYPTDSYSFALGHWLASASGIGQWDLNIQRHLDSRRDHSWAG